MKVERTELEWIYEPRDYFEAPYRTAISDFGIAIDDGKATATLTAPTESVPPDLEERIRSSIENVFKVRQLQLHKEYSLEGPRIYNQSDGRRNVTIRVPSASIMVMAGRVDFTLKDAAGNIVRDSKAERINDEVALLDSLAPKLNQSPILRRLFESYSRAVGDPDDELVHLYEIRDALCEHYGGEKPTRTALGIRKGEWQRLGSLANAEPLEQSRHRGKHLQQRRPATDEELKDARELVRKWIIAFAKAV